MHPALGEARLINESGQEEQAARHLKCTARVLSKVRLSSRCNMAEGQIAMKKRSASKEQIQQKKYRTSERKGCTRQ